MKIKEIFGRLRILMRHDYIGRRSCVRDIPGGFDIKQFMSQCNDERNNMHILKKKAKYLYNIFNEKLTSSELHMFLRKLPKYGG